jgi:hypothetical protein
VAAPVTTDPIAYVRDLWTKFAADGVVAVRDELGPDVTWEPLALDRPATREISASVHQYEAIGECVVAHGSLRIYRDHGLVDLQPSWVFFFRAGRLVRGAGYMTREEALAAVGEHRRAD